MVYLDISRLRLQGKESTIIKFKTIALGRELAVFRHMILYRFNSKAHIPFACKTMKFRSI
jgi:hypothetical protein